MNPDRKERVPWWRVRVFGLHPSYHHSYPAYAPKVVFHRVRHRLIGPLMGCSCTRCFKHPWRLYYWREGVHDRRRVADLERRVRELETGHAA